MTSLSFLSGLLFRRSLSPIIRQWMKLIPAYSWGVLAQNHPTNEGITLNWLSASGSCETSKHQILYSGKKLGCSTKFWQGLYLVFSQTVRSMQWKMLTRFFWYLLDGKGFYILLPVKAFQCLYTILCGFTRNRLETERRDIHVRLSMQLQHW